MECGGSREWERLENYKCMWKRLKLLHTSAQILCDISVFMCRLIMPGLSLLNMKKKLLVLKWNWRRWERERERDWDLEAGDLACVLVHMYSEYAEGVRQWICYALRVSQKYHWNALHKVWGDALCIDQHYLFSLGLVCDILAASCAVWVYCIVIFSVSECHGCYVDWYQLLSGVFVYT